MSKQASKDLDRALSSSSAPTDEELAELFDVGQRIRNAYASFTPGHSPQRAMFVGAVADRERPGFGRFLAPVTITAVLLIGLMFLGRTALPGGTFYPVRQVLRNVGLAPATGEEVRSLLDSADRLLDRAEEFSDRSPEAAERLAFEAVRVIGMAEGALDELEVDERARLMDDLADVLARAKAILTEEPDQDRDRDADGRAVTDDDGDDDGDTGRSSSGRSGPNPNNSVDARSGRNGSGHGSRREQSDDNRGSGNRTDDDNSGPGSNDDNAGDDGEGKRGPQNDTDSGKSGGADKDDADEEEEDAEVDDEETPGIDQPRKPQVVGRSRPRG